jgi:hypothetical protein
MTAKTFDLITNWRIIGGVALCVLSIIAGFDNFRTSVWRGLATSDWPTTVGRVTTASQSLGSSLGCPGCQMLVRYYVYEVDGRAYQSPNYDLHGPFVGTRRQIEQFKRKYKDPLTIYYNPKDPQHAILKRGISLDHTSFTSLAFFFAGLIFSAREFRRVVILHRQAENSLDASAGGS